MKKDHNQTTKLLSKQEKGFNLFSLSLSYFFSLLCFFDKEQRGFFASSLNFTSQLEQRRQTHTRTLH